ncbi:MAG: molecular chaperone DnaJ [bacterium]|nr:molecular chaperone DnaJ [bacterium]
MAARPDYYNTLGVKRGAGNDEIRRAYKRLARKYHPDLNPGDKAAEERFKHVQEAYDILNDPKKRKMFDQFGFYSDNAFPGGQHPQQGPGAGFGFGGFDFSGSPFGGGAGAEPPFGSGAGGGAGFADIFSQFFGRSTSQKPQARPEKGSDLEYALSIDFWQSIQGTQVRLKTNRQGPCAVCGGSGKGDRGSSVCPECNGAGTVSQMAGAMRFNLSCPRCDGGGKLGNTCQGCHGEGRVVQTDSVDVRIPPGVQSGARLRVGGKGNAGAMGGPAGDLYITVRVEPHPFFEREGDDIHIRVPVTVWEASLGTKIEVPTIDGRALLKIPQGTLNGQRFRLRDKGVRNSRKNSRGDQIVEVGVEPPPARAERTREILRELSDLHPEDPRSEIWSKV